MINKCRRPHHPVHLDLRPRRAAYHLNAHRLASGPKRTMATACSAGGKVASADAYFAPAGGFRGPLLGSRNVLTSVARGFGVPGGSSAAVQGTAAAIGLATVAIGMYDATIELEGFIYAAKDAPPSDSKCGCGN